MKPVMKPSNNRLILPLSMMITLVLGLQSGGFALSLLRIAEEFALNQTQMGVLVAVQFLAVLLMPLLLGPLGDRFGKKRLLFFSMPLFAFGCLLYVFSRSYLAAAIATFVAASGFSVTECTVSAVLCDAHPEKSGQYINISQCMFSFGMVAGPILARMILTYTSYTWRAVYIPPLTLMLLLIPLLPITHFSQPPKAQVDVPQKFLPFACGLIKKASFIGVLLSLVLYVGIESGFGNFIDALFTLELSAPSLGAYAISAFWFAMTISRLAFGFVRFSGAKTIAITLVFTIAGFFALRFSNSAALSVALCAFTGAAFGPVWPLLAAMGISHAPDRSGSVASLQTAISGLGGIFIPVLVGYVGDNSGLLQSLVFLGAGCALMLLIMLNSARRENKNIV